MVTIKKQGKRKAKASSKDINSLIIVMYKKETPEVILSSTNVAIFGSANENGKGKKWEMLPKKIGYTNYE